MENNRQNTLLLTVIAVATLLVAVIGATFAYFTANVTNQETASSVKLTAATLEIAYADGSGNSVILANQNIEPRKTTDPALIHKNFTLTPSSNINTTTVAGNQASDAINMPYVLQLIVLENTFQLTNKVTGTSLSYKLINNQDSRAGSIPDSDDYKPIAMTTTPTTENVNKNTERGGNAFQTQVLGPIDVYDNNGVKTTPQGINIGRGVFINGNNGSSAAHDYTLEIYFIDDGTVQDADEVKTFRGYINVSTGGSDTQLDNTTTGTNYGNA